MKRSLNIGYNKMRKLIHKSKTAYREKPKHFILLSKSGLPRAQCEPLTTRNLLAPTDFLEELRSWNRDMMLMAPKGSQASKVTMKVTLLMNHQCAKQVVMRYMYTMKLFNKLKRRWFKKIAINKQQHVQEIIETQLELKAQRALEEMDGDKEIVLEVRGAHFAQWRTPLGLEANHRLRSWVLEEETLIDGQMAFLTASILAMWTLVANKGKRGNFVASQGLRYVTTRRLNKNLYSFTKGSKKFANISQFWELWATTGMER